MRPEFGKRWPSMRRRGFTQEIGYKLFTRPTPGLMVGGAWQAGRIADSVASSLARHEPGGRYWPSTLQKFSEPASFIEKDRVKFGMFRLNARARRARFPARLTYALSAASLACAGLSGEISAQTPVGDLQNAQTSLGRATEGTGLYGPPAPPKTVPLETPPGIDLQLARAASMALTQYPSIAASEATVRASEAEIQAAKWLRYPSASVAVVTRDDEVGTLSPQVEIFQPIWTGGRISASIDRARATREVSRAELGVTAFDLLIRVTSAYYGVVRGIRIGAILETSLAEHERLVESMERRVTQEVSPRSDLDLARSRAAQVRQELSVVTAQRFASLQQLRELVGDPAFEVETLPVYSPADHHPSAEGLVNNALDCNPAIQRLEAETKVAEADRKLSEAAILPQVGVQLSHDRFAGTGVGLAVRAQTNGGLAPFAAAEAASARKISSEFRVTVAQRETREDTILDLVENTAARAQVESSAAAAESSTNVTDSFMRQFITGRRTWLDVMNAVRESNAARRALAEAEISAMSSAARLLVRSCRWHPNSVDMGGNQ